MVVRCSLASVARRHIFRWSCTTIRAARHPRVLTRASQQQRSKTLHSLPMVGRWRGTWQGRSHVQLALETIPSSWRPRTTGPRGASVTRAPLWLVGVTPTGEHHCRPLVATAATGANDVSGPIVPLRVLVRKSLTYSASSAWLGLWRMGRWQMGLWRIGLCRMGLLTLATSAG